MATAEWRKSQKEKGLWRKSQKGQRATLPSLQKTLVDFTSNLHGDSAFKGFNGGDLRWLFSGLRFQGNNAGKISKIWGTRTETRGKIRKIRVTFVLQLFWSLKKGRIGTDEFKSRIWNPSPLCGPYSSGNTQRLRVVFAHLPLVNEFPHFWLGQTDWSWLKLT